MHACLSFKASPGAQPFKWKGVGNCYANHCSWRTSRFSTFNKILLCMHASVSKRVLVHNHSNGNELGIVMQITAVRGPVVFQHLTRSYYAQPPKERQPQRLLFNNNLYLSLTCLAKTQKIFFCCIKLEIKCKRVSCSPETLGLRLKICRISFTARRHYCRKL